MLGGERVERAREPLERVLGVAEAEAARLLQGREGLGDARDAELVRGDVEVGDGVADELRGGRGLVGGVVVWVAGGRGRTVEGSSSRSILAVGGGWMGRGV